MLGRIGLVTEPLRRNESNNSFMGILKVLKTTLRRNHQNELKPGVDAPGAGARALCSDKLKLDTERCITGQSTV